MKAFQKNITLSVNEFQDEEVMQDPGMDPGGTGGEYVDNAVGSTLLSLLW